jgi:hypothetical protein
MAQAQRERPASEVNTDQLLSIVRQLPRAMGPTHPTNAPTVLAAGANALKISQILEIVRGSRPAESDPRRQVYDAAVQTLGEGNRNEALAFLVRSHAASIHRLAELVNQGNSISENGPQLETMLARIDRGIGQGESGYGEYETVGSDVTALLRTIRGGAMQEAPRAQDVATGRRQLPLIETPLRDFGPVHLLSSSASESVVAVNATVTPTTSSLFGGEDVARQAMGALGNAYATLANHPNDLAAQQAAAHTLQQALSQIPSGKEIWNASVHPHFAAAMTALSAGNLQQGLTELTQETALNSVFGSLNNLYVISVNQRAISVMRAGVTVRYEFDQNMEAFTEYIRGSRQGQFEPRLLWMALGLYYERLLVSGELRQYAVQTGAGGAGTLSQVGSQRLTGTGDVFSVTPQVALGASAWGNPMQIIFHCNLGYQQYELGANVQSPGGPAQRVSVGDNGAYIGIWGVEAQFPGREGQRSMIRMNRADIGAVGSPQNFFASISFEGNWVEGNVMRIRSEVTPQYSYFLEQHRVGADIRPADFQIQIHPEWTLFFGPGFRYDYNATTQAHYLEGYGTIGFRFDRGVALDLRGGFLGEIGGPEGQRVPSTPYGSLNLTITPQLWGRDRTERRITGEAVPARRQDTTSRRRRRSQE